MDLYAPGGGETRCSAVWLAHLFWVQRAIGSNPVTLMWRIQKKMNVGVKKIPHLVKKKYQTKMRLIKGRAGQVLKNRKKEKMMNSLYYINRKKEKKKTNPTKTNK